MHKSLMAFRQFVSTLNLRFNSFAFLSQQFIRFDATLNFCLSNKIVRLKEFVLSQNWNCNSLELVAYNESVFAMAGFSVFRHAGTEVDYCFIVQDKVCRLIINVKPEL